MFPFFDLKAHEHNAVGRKTSQLEQSDLQTSQECSIFLNILTILTFAPTFQTFKTLTHYTRYQLLDIFIIKLKLTPC